MDIGKCFFGESMFSDMENGSKAALIALARILDKNGYLMIDCQFRMPHLENMGGVAVGFAEYKELLEEGMRQGEHLSALGCSDFGAVDVGAFFNK